MAGRGGRLESETAYVWMALRCVEGTQNAASGPSRAQWVQATARRRLWLSLSPVGAASATVKVDVLSDHRLDDGGAHKRLSEVGLVFQETSLSMIHGRVRTEVRSVVAEAVLDSCPLKLLPLLPRGSHSGEASSNTIRRIAAARRLAEADSAGGETGGTHSLLDSGRSHRHQCRFASGKRTRRQSARARRPMLCPSHKD